MPKLKTNKSIRKRFKVTATGKVLMKKRMGRGHLLAHKPPKRKRNLRKQPVLCKTDAAFIRKELQVGLHG
jgi:large subunit ribosomal protein L35